VKKRILCRDHVLLSAYGLLSVTEQFDFHEIRYASFFATCPARVIIVVKIVSVTVTRYLKDVSGFVTLISISLDRFEKNSTSNISLVASSFCEFGDDFCTASCVSQKRKLISVIFSAFLILSVSNSVERMSTKILGDLEFSENRSSESHVSIIISHLYFAHLLWERL
jgi:hypothetical protein